MLLSINIKFPFRLSHNSHYITGNITITTTIVSATGSQSALGIR